MIRRFLRDDVLERVQQLKPVAAEVGLSMAQLAVAWVLQNPNVASAIIGASRPEQVHENVKASGVELPAEVLTQDRRGARRPAGDRSGQDSPELTTAAAQLILSDRDGQKSDTKATCGRSGWPAGRLGCSKRQCSTRPKRRITAIDAGSRLPSSTRPGAAAAATVPPGAPRRPPPWRSPASTPPGPVASRSPPRPHPAFPAASG